MRQPELGAFLAAFGLSPAALEGREDAKRRRLASGRRLRLGSLGSLTFGARARGGLAPHAEGAPAGPALPACGAQTSAHRAWLRARFARTSGPALKQDLLFYDLLTGGRKCIACES